MDDIDRAKHQEEMARARAVAAARTNFGKKSEGWVDCLADLQKRERAGR